MLLPVARGSFPSEVGAEDPRTRSLHARARREVSRCEGGTGAAGLRNCPGACEG